MRNGIVTFEKYGIGISVCFGLVFAEKFPCTLTMFNIAVFLGFFRHFRYVFCSIHLRA